MFSYLMSIILILFNSKICFLTFSLPVTHWSGDNTDLPSTSGIRKTVRVNTAFSGTFLKGYLISFLMKCKLIDFALVVL